MGIICYLIFVKERKLTPKEQRSRDRWRLRGDLAKIQFEEGLSRQELAEKFKREAETIMQGPTKITQDQDESAQDPLETEKESARWMGYYYRKMHTGWVIKKKR